MSLDLTNLTGTRVPLEVTPENRAAVTPESLPKAQRTTVTVKLNERCDKESWAGNVTVLGGLLTGIFGTSEVVKALLGADADSTIALATVGSAIAVAFIGVGPVILSATKVKKSDRYSVRGMLFAAGFTISGGIGELAIVTITAWRMDLGVFWQVPVLAAGAAGGVLLCVYFARSVAPWQITTRRRQGSVTGS